MTMFQNLRRMMGGAATLKISWEACGHEATWTSAQAFQRLPVTQLRRRRHQGRPAKARRNAPASRPGSCRPAC